MRHIRPSHLTLAVLAGTLIAEPANACPTCGMSVPAISPAPSVKPSTPNININIPRPPTVDVRPSSGASSGGDGGGYVGKSGGSRGPTTTARGPASPPVSAGGPGVGSPAPVWPDPVIIEGLSHAIVEDGIAHGDDMEVMRLRFNRAILEEMRWHPGATLQQRVTQQLRVWELEIERLGY
jgi:hypothetical protein